MSSQDNRVTLQCAQCGNRNYFPNKNKKTIKNRLELSKFCKECSKHSAHKETK